MRFYCILLCCLTGIGLKAQKPIDCAVMLTASVFKSPPAIILSWPEDTNATEFKVYRKALTDKNWIELGILGGDGTSWADTAVVGAAYEYQVIKKVTVNDTNIIGHGYIYSGIEVPQIENRGKIILLIAQNLFGPLSGEIKRLKSDMAADGWQVYTDGVLLTETVPEVKAKIEKLYKSDPANFKALLILGHIAVPYSGNFAVDGHLDHQGAWAADMYYGDMDGEWTDDDVYDTSAARKENWNVPDDGKFDESIIPSDIELQVGRIDLSNLPVFSGLGEIDLMKRYLDKNHAFRTAQFNPKMKAVVEDNFGWVKGGAFSASAYKNFAPMVGTENVFTQDWKTSLNTDTFIWAYGTGGGNYTSANKIIKSSDFADGSVYSSVFTNLFGSYFGDWDSQDNLMRSALASPGMILTCAWSGRPQWLFQHMALGETIGFSTRLSMNDYTAYFRSAEFGSHVRLSVPALMGDPTLRLHMNPMPSGLSVTTTGNGQELAWSPAAGAPEGYHVYRTTGPDKPWTRLTSAPISATTGFTDNTPGNFQYLVRALYLQESPSGTYYNLSQGISHPDTLPSGIEPQKHALEQMLFAYPNPSNGTVNIVIPEGNGTSGEIAVINQLGAVVHKQNVTGGTTTLDLQKLAKGLYTVQYRGHRNDTVLMIRVVVR